MIGQIFAYVGANDSCNNRMGKLDFWLGCQLASYQEEDSPPTRVRPKPVRVIQALDIAAQGTDSRNIAINDLTWVAFFLLLWPGEYYKGGTNTNQQPFRLMDDQLFIEQHPYNAASAYNTVLAQADFYSLMFTTQKNGVNGESIGLRCNSHPQECPVAAMRCQVAYLRYHGATGETPI